MYKLLECLLVGALVDIDPTSLALGVPFGLFQDVFVWSRRVVLLGLEQLVGELVLGQLRA